MHVNEPADREVCMPPSTFKGLHNIVLKVMLQPRLLEIQFNFLHIPLALDGAHIRGVYTSGAFQEIGNWNRMKIF